MKTTDNVVARFKKAIDVNRFTITQELEMFEILVNKYNFRSVSQYAREEKISQPAALKRLKKGKVMYIELIGHKFIIN